VTTTPGAFAPDRVTVARKLFIVGATVAWEKLTGPTPKTLGDVPHRTDAMTAGWLQQVLCAEHPNAKVLGVEFGGGSSGTTHRRALLVRYNDAGIRAGLPTALYNKSSDSLVSRLTVGLAGILPGEKGFYTLVEPELDVETPHAYFADYDARTWRSSILLDDVATTKGARFCTPFDQITRPQIEGMLDVLAGVHGRYWNSPRLDNDFRWLKTPNDHQDQIAKFISMRGQCAVGLDRSVEILPPGLHRQRDRLWSAYVTALDLATKGSPTFLHGDCHVANYYQTDTGRMGLCDWQVSLKGLWAYDYCYTLTSALSIENRRAWERDLLGYYLDRLHAEGGPQLGFDDAWLAYRQQPLYGLHAWLWTVGRSRLQPKMHPPANCLSLIERMSHAVADLESITALGH